MSADSLPHESSTVQVKQCSQCKEIKSLDLFYRRKDGKFGRNNKCKACDLRRLLEWRLAHPQAAKAIKDRYVSRNRDKVKASKKRYVELHPEARLASIEKYRETDRQKCREYRKTHKKEMRAMFLAWAAKNPHRMIALANKRRARMKGATIGDQSAVIEFYRTVRTSKRLKCHWCGKLVPKKERCVDHIVPLAKNGAHAVDNLCCACDTCNSEKHAQSAEYFIKRKGLQKHLVGL